MTDRYKLQRERRKIAVDFLAVYGIDGNKVIQDSISRDGYGHMLDGEELIALPREELTEVVMASAHFPIQRRAWPEGFPIDQFMELYDAIVR